MQTNSVIIFCSLSEQDIFATNFEGHGDIGNFILILKNVHSMSLIGLTSDFMIGTHVDKSTYVILLVAMASSESHSHVKGKL